MNALMLNVFDFSVHYPAVQSMGRRAHNGHGGRGIRLFFLLIFSFGGYEHSLRGKERAVSKIC